MSTVYVHVHVPILLLSKDFFANAPEPFGHLSLPMYIFIGKKGKVKVYLVLKFKL